MEKNMWRDLESRTGDVGEVDVKASMLQDTRMPPEGALVQRLDVHSVLCDNKCHRSTNGTWFLDISSFSVFKKVVVLQLLILWLQKKLAESIICQGQCRMAAKAWLKTKTLTTNMGNFLPLLPVSPKTNSVAKKLETHFNLTLPILPLTLYSGTK